MRARGASAGVCTCRRRPVSIPACRVTHPLRGEHHVSCVHPVRSAPPATPVFPVGGGGVARSWCGSPPAGSADAAALIRVRRTNTCRGGGAGWRRHHVRNGDACVRSSCIIISARRDTCGPSSSRHFCIDHGIASAWSARLASMVVCASSFARVMLHGYVSGHAVRGIFHRVRTLPGSGGRRFLQIRRATRDINAISGLLLPAAWCWTPARQPFLPRVSSAL